ncbi:DUF1566 domain-containing protein [Thiospirillum jenense]|uniref:DUF1566 domain-containing protein n=1 Tax=Thiospirillum jenense TaxID=1653858 RepID=A0A839HF28_9GAMM|nr:DUF1566 domain-containing protein [Thiospirillum jenense]MBB1127074.1 DUF1566 domain-containing protein [Thiospirillum jenense]
MQNNDSTQPTKNPAIPLDEELLRFLLEFGIEQRTDEYLRQLARLAAHAANIDKNYLRQLTQVATSVANTNKQLSTRLEQIEAQQQLFTGQLQQFNQAMTAAMDKLARMEMLLNAQQLLDAQNEKIDKATTESALINGRYRDLGDSTVLDVKTNLQWMRCALGQTWDGKTCVGEATKFNWNDAKIAAQECRHAGFSDWRLPSINELKTLIYCSSGKPKLWNDTGFPCRDRYDKPVIDSVVFPMTPCIWFLSNSFYKDRLLRLDFSDGEAYSNLPTTNSLVRLVRRGQ